VRWPDIKAAIMTELGNAETVGPLAAAIAILHLIPPSELFLFFSSKEGIASILSCCTSDNLDMRAACVTAISPLLVDQWLLVEGQALTPEGLMKTGAS
jgi:hypothetical protein